MKTKSTLNKILNFIYFAVIFLILYWIFVFLFKNLVHNVARAEWLMDGKIIFQSLVKRDMRSGDIFDENIIKGRRTVVYQTWSLDRWPCETW